MPLTPGEQAEIVRSNQKDEYYLGYLKSALSDIVHTWLGPRRWVTWQKETDVLAEVIYFGLTTLGGLQTLGEEYVGLIQTDSTRRQIPSFLRRLVMVGLQIFSPYLLQSLVNKAEHHLRTNPSLPLSADARGHLLQVLPTLRYTLTLLQRCHLALFYLNGAFYHIAKRLAGVPYVRVATGNNSGSSLVYKILGSLSVLQLVLAGLQHVYTHSSQSSTNSNVSIVPSPSHTSRMADEEEEEARPGLKCSLCLERRLKTTATPCGHLYCWTCIHEWCGTKLQCPICRQPCTSQELVYLRNID